MTAGVISSSPVPPPFRTLAECASALLSPERPSPHLRLIAPRLRPSPRGHSCGQGRCRQAIQERG